MLPLPPDPYKALGVSKNAELSEIRSAHRKLVLKTHPDKFQDPQQKAEKQDEFQKVQQAYEILSDADERKKYDELVKRHEEKRQEMAQPRTPSRYPPYTTKVEIRTAEPPFVSKASPTANGSAKMYSRGASRSFEDDPIYKVRVDELQSRRSASYDDRSGRRESEDPRRKADDKKSRQREKEREKEREAAREKVERDRKRQEKLEKEKEKERLYFEDMRRADQKKARKDADKSRDRGRKKDAEDKKIKSRTAYVEEYDDYYETVYDDEPAYTRPKDKKSPTRRRSEEKAEKESRVVDPRRLDAINYINKSKSKRSDVVAPPRVPMPPADEESPRRSSAAPRRGSHDSRSGDPSFHKKPSSSARYYDEPLEYGSDPYNVVPPSGKSRRTGLARATTTLPAQEFVVHEPVFPPKLSRRAETFHGGYPEAAIPQRSFKLQYASDRDDDYGDYSPRERIARSSRQRTLSPDVRYAKYDMPRQQHAYMDDGYRPSRGPPAEVYREFPAGLSTGGSNLSSSSRPEYKPIKVVRSNRVDPDKIVRAQWEVPPAHG